MSKSSAAIRYYLLFATQGVGIALMGVAAYLAWLWLNSGRGLIGDGYLKWALGIGIAGDSLLLGAMRAKKSSSQTE